MGWFWGSYTSKTSEFAGCPIGKPESYLDRIKREMDEEKVRKLKKHGRMAGIPFLLFWGLWFVFIICRWYG